MNLSILFSALFILIILAIYLWRRPRHCEAYTPEADDSLFRKVDKEGNYPEALYAPYYFPIADRPWYQPWRRWAN